MTDTIRQNGGYKVSEKGRINLNSLALQSDLREKVKGEVRFDAGTQAIYAHDSSNYRQMPVQTRPTIAHRRAAARTGRTYAVAFRRES